jgi:superfamily II DNA or RNA helicase
VNAPPLRSWQKVALEKWNAAGQRGIIEVVTGGGKTIFALSCVRELRAQSTLVVVPTLALQDQWWEEAAFFFDIRLDDINIVSGGGRIKPGTINIAVLNTAARLAAKGKARPCFLIVDECHKAASPQFRSVFDIPSIASLGLSATPDRPYDQGLSEILVPALGPVIYRYDYKDAVADGVVVNFKLHNIVFELEPDRQRDYDKLTRSIAQSINRYGLEAPETVALMLKRSRIANLSLTRIRLAVRLVALNSGKRILVFHEDIEAGNLIHEILVENGIRAGVYHSRLPIRERTQTLAAYRSGDLDVLVTCRALDEGLNVPETEIGIIAASTATRRQRIQRLGRILRPTAGKNAAAIFTLVATSGEITRLKEEEEALEGVAEIIWSKA